MGFDIKRLNGINLTWIIYPIVIFLTGVYIIPNLYKLIIEWNRPPMIVLTLIFYVIAFTLIPIGFVYLALEKVRLKFKLSVLSVIGIILILVFSHGLIEYFFQGHSLLDILTIGFDHWTFPIAFGFFYLCDLSKIPKRFWFFLLPFALFGFVMGNTILIGNSISNSNMFQCIGSPNFPFAFFGVNNWEEMRALSDWQFWDSFKHGFLQEFLTFFTLFPMVIFSYLLRKEKDKKC